MIAFLGVLGASVFLSESSLRSITFCFNFKNKKLSAPS